MRSTCYASSVDVSTACDDARTVPKQSLRVRFAASVRARRADCGWSQEVLAERAGLHRTYISSIERAERNVSIDNIERIATALGVGASDLLAAPGRDAK